MAGERKAKRGGAKEMVGSALPSSCLPALLQTFFTGLEKGKGKEALEPLPCNF